MKYTLNCQAICDEKGYFIDVDLRWPGSVHDARVYANSQINKKFANKDIACYYQQLVPRFPPIPPILIGDPAYPLLPNVMKEYANCIDNKQINFNNKLRITRNQIECAFGRLKARWRILNWPVGVDIDLAVTLIFSCFVLHNYCEKHKVDIQPEYLQTQMEIEKRNQHCAHHNNLDKLYSYNTSRGKII